jgi:hypothetical protein
MMRTAMCLLPIKPFFDDPKIIRATGRPADPHCTGLGQGLGVISVSSVPVGSALNYRV